MLLSSVVLCSFDCIYLFSITLYWVWFSNARREEGKEIVQERKVGEGAGSLDSTAAIRLLYDTETEQNDLHAHRQTHTHTHTPNMIKFNAWERRRLRVCFESGSLWATRENSAPPGERRPNRSNWWYSSISTRALYWCSARVDVSQLCSTQQSPDTMRPAEPSP